MSDGSLIVNGGFAVEAPTRRKALKWIAAAPAILHPQLSYARRGFRGLCPIPDDFRIDRDHPDAQGLIFAGLPRIGGQCYDLTGHWPAMVPTSPTGFLSGGQSAPVPGTGNAGGAGVFAAASQVGLTTTLPAAANPVNGGSTASLLAFFEILNASDSAGLIFLDDPTTEKRFDLNMLSTGALHSALVARSVNNVTAGNFPCTSPSLMTAGVPYCAAAAINTSALRHNLYGGGGLLYSASALYSADGLAQTLSNFTALSLGTRAANRQAITATAASGATSLGTLSLYPTSTDKTSYISGTGLPAGEQIGTNTTSSIGLTAATTAAISGGTVYELPNAVYPGNCKMYLALAYHLELIENMPMLTLDPSRVGYSPSDLNW